jgi:hypothetical protein
MDFLQLSPVIEQAHKHAGFEAGALNHELREPGHLLLGILKILGSNNTARTALTSYGITYEVVFKAVGGWYKSAETSSSFVELDSPDTIDVLLLTDQLAQQDGDHIAYQRLDHLLRVLIEHDIDNRIRVLLTNAGIYYGDMLWRLDIEVANSSN